MEERAKNFKDLTGQTFGRWHVMEFAGTKTTKRGAAALWLCACECGTQRSVRSADLITGKSKSCGCLGNELFAARLTKHGMAGTKVHRIWKSMWTRCTNKNVPHHATYRYRTPPEEWKSFDTFYADMGPMPTEKHSIDRIDNSLPYSKENCRWALPAEQSRNTSRNRFYTYNGVTKCLTDWAVEYGIDKTTLLGRLDRGWDFETSITKPPRNLRGRNC